MSLLALIDIRSGGHWMLFLQTYIQSGLIFCGFCFIAMMAYIVILCIAIVIYTLLYDSTAESVPEWVKEDMEGVEDDQVDDDLEWDDVDLEWKDFEEDFNVLEVC